jgi:hypothetical protein
VENVTLSLADVQTLEQKKLSESDHVDSDFVDDFKLRFFSCFLVLGAVLLHYRNLLVVRCKLKQDEVLSFWLQVARRTQRMKHLFLA